MREYARPSARPSPRSGHQAASHGSNTKAATTGDTPIHAGIHASSDDCRWARCVSRSRPAIEDPARTMKGKSSHGAIGRVLFPNVSNATTTRARPTSLSMPWSSWSGRGSMDRHSKIGKAHTHQSTRATKTRDRDQRHNTPRAGTTGHAPRSVIVASRVGDKRSPSNASHHHRPAAVAAMTTDRPTSSNTSCMPARRLSANVTRSAGGGGTITESAAAAEAGPVARMRRAIAAR